VGKYFKEYIENCEPSIGLPRKAEIVAFQDKHKEITYEWTVSRTKVLNEQKAFRKRTLNNMKKMRM